MLLAFLEVACVDLPVGVDQTPLSMEYLLSSIVDHLSEWESMSNV